MDFCFLINLETWFTYLFFIARGLINFGTFKLGGLIEKLPVATWDLWDRVSICLKTQYDKCILCQDGRSVSGTFHKPELRLNTQFVSVIKTSQSMLYGEIIAICSQIHTKHINTLCGQNVELLNVKLAVHIVTTGL